MPVWASIAWRVSFTVGLVVLAVFVHWAERDGLQDVSGGHISFIDVFYFTMISITTTGYGDIVPVSEQARLFDALVVTPIRLFVVLVFVGTAYSFVFRRTWDRWLMAYIQSHLHGHIVLSGYGTSGAQAVEELIARGTKARDIVVIDRDPERLERARSVGCSVMIGDATRDRILDDAKVTHAKAMIVSAGRDDTSILVTLTARRLAPGLPISIAVRNHDNELPARQAGATTVINPAGFRRAPVANAAYGPRAVDYWQISCRATEGSDLRTRDQARGIRKADVVDSQRIRGADLSERPTLRLLGVGGRVSGRGRHHRRDTAYGRIGPKICLLAIAEISRASGFDPLRTRASPESAGDTPHLTSRLRSDLMI